MKRFSKLPGNIVISITVAFSVILNSVCFCMPVQAEAADTPREININVSESADYSQDEVIVVFNDKVSDTKAENIVVDNIDAVSVDTINTQEDGSTSAVVEIPEDMDVTDAISELSSSDDIAYVQPNYIYHLSDYQNVTDSLNDSGADYQWYLNKIGTKSAWDYIKTHNHSKVRVAVLDTGINVNHPDLQANLNRSLSVDVTRTASGGGYARLINDIGDHGTHVAGIMAATSGNSIGIAGVASGYDNDIIELIGINVFFYDRGEVVTSTKSVMAALEYARKCNVRVVNMSFGNYGVDTAFENSIKKMVDSGMVIVAAGGNEGRTDYHGPSDFDGVIGVISIDNFSDTTKNCRSAFSDYGVAKDVCAPGSDIISTVANASYSYKAGTSMATPIVASVCAMMLSVKPSMTVAQVRKRIINTATDLYTPGFDTSTANGMVNAAKAVDMSYTPPNKIAVSKNSVSMDVGAVRTLTAAVMPAGAASSNIIWYSSNNSVVSVSGGKLVGLKAGSATVTAWTGNKIASCLVKVKKAGKVSVKSVSLNISKVKLKVGQQLKLVSMISPNNASNKSVKYKSSNTAVAKVASDGTIRAVSKGKATIKAITADGKKKAKCKVTVR